MRSSPLVATWDLYSNSWWRTISENERTTERDDGFPKGKSNKPKDVQLFPNQFLGVGSLIDVY